jgi:hypothetical protein
MNHWQNVLRRQTGRMTSGGLHTSEPKKRAQNHVRRHISRAQGKRTLGRVDSVPPCMVVAWWGIPGCMTW